ncbi:hypothetical protein EVAR_43984_1 [Eumeta japonica]|uniref:Uncharacterized protein n=1 Tax=Eumeta variegata TaxID=151549 RepID=A0A4C1XGD7_EUMVA|nr:hypothetical protein EVAR_43984_1 [Eumeta japonica]
MRLRARGRTARRSADDGARRSGLEASSTYLLLLTVVTYGPTAFLFQIEGLLPWPYARPDRVRAQLMFSRVDVTTLESELSVYLPFMKASVPVPGPRAPSVSARARVSFKPY